MPYNDKSFRESNINYLNKDFHSLKQSLMNYAKSYFPDTYRDFNETSPGMMLLEMSAYVGDVLSFYIDQQYREMILPLTEERKNILNMAKMFGYKVKPIIPSHCYLTFTDEISAETDHPEKVDYSDAGVFPKGIKVNSITDSSLVFETLDVVDFTISQSNDTLLMASTDQAGLAESYNLKRTVRAVSGEEKSMTFEVGTPKKFLKLTIPDTNVIDIISVFDSNGNEWYEVDYLAQDRIPIETHYTNGNRDTAYRDIHGTDWGSGVPVPYALEYITTHKRFTRETNFDNSTSLIFGNGILKGQNTIGSTYLELEQAGIIVPGQMSDLNDHIDPLVGDEYSTLGEAPSQINLTVRYRVGGGIDSNVIVGELTQFENSTILPIGGNGSARLDSVINNSAARGGRDSESLHEIKQKTLAFFTTQNRCVTKEDYQARILNMSSKFGSIAKVYVERSNIIDYIAGSMTNYISGVDSLLSTLTTQAQTDSTTLADIATSLSNFSSNVTTPTPGQITQASEMGTVNIYLLTYNDRKELVGNPLAVNAGLSDYVPTLLKQNVAKYLDDFKILTEQITIQDGYVINFGVFFDVIAEKWANKTKIKMLCIEALKDYFSIDKMQFNQPIYISQLEYVLMNISGVRSVNYVCLSQEENHIDTSQPPLDNETFRYSINESVDDNGDTTTSLNTNGTIGYGYRYDFSAATGALRDGVILPPDPTTPGVFELKNPNQNIKGVVR